MKLKNIQYLKKLCIQLDNANNNKGWAVIIGLSVLIVLGICEKIVVAFLLVAYAHGRRPNNFVCNYLLTRNGYSYARKVEDARAELFPS